jgi:hypothetical protein
VAATAVAGAAVVMGMAMVKGMAMATAIAMATATATAATTAIVVAVAVTMAAAVAALHDGNGNCSNDDNSGGSGDNSADKDDIGSGNGGSGSTTAVATTMAVVAGAVVTMMAWALTSGGDGGSHGIGEVESSKGGTVLHLQASGSSIGHGAIDKPTEEDTGEGGGDPHCCHGFDGRDRGLLSPCQHHQAQCQQRQQRQ